MSATRIYLSDCSPLENINYYLIEHLQNKGWFWKKYIIQFDRHLTNVHMFYTICNKTLEKKMYTQLASLQNVK